MPSDDAETLTIQNYSNIKMFAIQTFIFLVRYIEMSIESHHLIFILYDHGKHNKASQKNTARNLVKNRKTHLHI